MLWSFNNNCNVSHIYNLYLNFKIKNFNKSVWVSLENVCSIICKVNLKPGSVQQK